MNDKKTVLIVDDDSDFLETTRLALRKDYEVKTALSGEECLKAVAAQKPAAIVMDVMMNDVLDGLETAKKLKESAATRDIPIVMLTSVNQHFDYRTQVADGYYPRDRWFDKPVRAEDLRAALRELMA